MRRKVRVMSEVKEQNQRAVKKENRTLKNFRFTDNTIQKIEQVADELSCTQTAAVELMIRKYFENRTKEYNEMHSLLLELKENVNRVRVTSNVIDRNTQMQIEFWNHYFIVNQFKGLGTTEKYKAEELTEAEMLIKKRIAHLRQKKLDWESTREKRRTRT